MKVTVNVEEPEVSNTYKHGTIFYESFTRSYVMLCQLDAGMYGIVGLDGNRFTSPNELVPCNGSHIFTLEQCQPMAGSSCKLRPVAPGTVITLTVE